MLLELTAFESELERLLGSSMPGHGGGTEKPERELEPAPDEEPESEPDGDPDEKDPA